MIRFRPMALASSFLALAVSAMAAEEAQTAQELRELRQVVQQQSRHIELLAEQVARLTRLIDVRAADSPVASPPATPVEAPKPPAEPVPEAPKAELVVKAEPGPAGVKHVVAKGETLTSIAKQYNIPVTDLKNANKIENERKLQIGQTLTVPTVKTPVTPDKKENP
jgi:LysM repeat protein